MFSEEEMQRRFLDAARNPLQAAFDAVGELARLNRAETQMTLGGLITEIESQHADCRITAIGNAHSYRGYYSDLAFEQQSGEITGAELLKLLYACLGTAFEGYKGGTFYMTRDTPLWLAHYSMCGDRIMGVDTTGDTIVFLAQPDEF